MPLQRGWLRLQQPRPGDHSTVPCWGGARSPKNAELHHHNQTSNKDVEPLHNLLESWMTRRRGETRPHLLQLKYNPPFPKHLYFIHGENQTCALWFYLRGFLSLQAWACTSLKGGGERWGQTLKAVRASSHRYTAPQRGEQSPPSWQEQITVRIQNHDEVTRVARNREVKHVCMLKWVQHDLPLCF